MNNHPVITIGRQCGSSGKIIGQKLAEELGIKCYDKELLALASKNSGFSEELFQSHDEKPTNSFLYSLVMDTHSLGFTTSGYMDMPINHKLFLAQFETIKKLAMEEPCVIVGRCADYALSEYPNLISVFISAKDEDKIQLLKERNQIDDTKAKDLMVKTDKRRSSYYNYYSSKKWGDVRSYDLCVNSSSVGVDGAVRVIKRFVEEKMSQLK
ncbi:cytidylate kinase-like family protein [Lacrimispora algidixylanolytica]|uniref:Cytidylate kinase n=1 Tax=Lacrimispora algidixylanolytica TaxID=94868 RepID=A0A419T9V8_9FIRM|nr:cytidylate kinase-like family protein [Lacrimispora algidixylanolytica]RKD34237.1 cytidylate kinase [Lacrimispora algidixylanolytica]